MSSSAYAEGAGTGRATSTGLPPMAGRFLLQTAAAATAGGIAASLGNGRHGSWSTFAILLIAATVAQAAATQVKGNQLFHTGLAFTVAAAVTLPPLAIIAICVAQHLGDWIRQRYPWYIQAFNVANYTLSALAAWGVNDAIRHAAGGASGSEALGVVAAVAGGIAFVATNHALLARMLRLARGHSLRATGLFSIDGLLTDASLAATGVGVATSLAYYPWAVAVAAFPLILIHRTLVIPELRAQAIRDPKTGLLNMRGFREAAEAELGRATRFTRPLGVVLADVDDLRGINNRHGHLAGDAALAIVADAIRATSRDYDICARFGGDEFVILLPETTLDQTNAFAARLEQRVASELIAGRAAPTPLGISVGVAALAAAAEGVDELLHRADASMYQAKRQRTVSP